MILKTILLALILAFFVPASALHVEVDIDSEMARLLKEIDRNHDQRITVNDWVGTRKPPRFWLKDLKGKEYEVSGIYNLSNLLQEMKLASEAKKNWVESDRVFEAPVHRISRLIRDSYWSALTRVIDAEHVGVLLDDPKIPKPLNKRVLYVPADDAEALDYYKAIATKNPALKFQVEPLKFGERPQTPGLLSLGLERDRKGELRSIPFVVPGGRFNEMYGWDSYFEVLGLIHDQRLDLAKGLADNLIYEIEHYGKILNANRSYYLNRSQPPFLTSLIRALYPHMIHSAENKAWLEKAVRAAIREYTQVWMNSEHLTDTGLSRYSGGPSDHLIPTEVEPGHFDFMLKPEAKFFKLSLWEFRKRFETAGLSDPKLDEFLSQDLAVRESGHDTTYRWRVGKVDRAADFVTVDLNALLYKYEIDLAKLLEHDFSGQLILASGKVSKASEWKARAQKRKSLMLQYLWNPKENLFFDYNYKDKVQSTFVSATAIYPLWAIDPEDPSTKILSDREAHKTILKVLSELEQPGGLTSTAKHSRDAVKSVKENLRQWPRAWALRRPRASRRSDLGFHHGRGSRTQRCNLR